MGQIYSLYRVNGGPTQHPEIPRPVTVDVLETGFILASCILFVCFALTIPGYKGKSRLYFTLRVVLSLFIGSAILIGVLGQEWETSEIETVTPYKAFTNQEIHAKVGIKIGLGSVNITLKGTPEKQNLSSSSNHVVEETINYNERFTWAWRQGRFGYGPYAGRIAREFRSAQYRGLPLPILWVAEYFVLDGELIRWGRSFRTAGWFANEVLWTAFPLYVIANILTFMVLLYAGVMFSVTGICMLVSTVIWATIKWGTQPMIIPFEDGYLETHYGPHFWLVIAGGIVSTLYGLVIVVMDTYFQNEIYDFFGKDILADTEEFYPETKEIINEDDETYGTRNKQTTVRRRTFGAASRRVYRLPTAAIKHNRASVVDHENRTLGHAKGAVQRKLKQKKASQGSARMKYMKRKASHGSYSKFEEGDVVYENTMEEQPVYENLQRK